MIPTNPIPEVPNYGSSAIYKDLPSEEQIRAGVIPLDSLPAAWWNALWACTNGAVNEARSAVGTLITEVCNAITGAGICINPSCVDQLYQAIETIRQRIGNAAVAGAVKSSPNCGEVSIDANGIMTANGVGNAALLNTSSKVVVNAINELKSTYDCCFTDLSGCIGSVDNSKAPTSHASANTTYGVGNADCYGHVKISDTYDSCVGAAADGIAASQLAVYCVYQAVQSAAGLGNTAGCALGTAAAGTCNSAARSDHVHPMPSLVTCSCRLLDNGGCTTIFCWSGANIRPSWVWGSSARGTTCLYNPACWTVAQATNASHAVNASAALRVCLATLTCVGAHTSSCKCYKNCTGYPVLVLPQQGNMDPVCLANNGIICRCSTPYGVRVY